MGDRFRVAIIRTEDEWPDVEQSEIDEIRDAQAVAGKATCLSGWRELEPKQVSSGVARIWECDAERNTEAS